MRREDLRRLFVRARELCGETDYVVLGSLAVLGCAGEVPPRMAASIDVDAYSKSDPARIFDLVPALGRGSPFEREHGYYLDPISPRVATLPEGWDGRLTRIQLDPSVAAWFLEPNDAAVSKYARMEPRDREWIRPGLGGNAFCHPGGALRRDRPRDEAARSQGARGGPPLWARGLGPGAGF
jgi:hypothetical protein